jgi:hypothetical protein
MGAVDGWATDTGVMWIAVAMAAVIALVLLCAWLIDRSAAKRGLRIHVRHTGLRREVTFTRIDDGTPHTWRDERTTGD